MSKFPSVSIIVVNWNGQADTWECLASLASLSYPNVTVIVVDNGSRTDEAATLSAAFPADGLPRTIILSTGENLGFTGGNNVGIRHALERGTDYILCLNNDTVVDPHFLGPLVQALEEDPGAGVAVPHIFLFGEPLEPWYVGAECSFDLAVLASRRTPAWHTLPTAAHLEQKMPYETQVATGCALLARADVMRRLGGFDDRYFAYFEDVDLSLRVARMGLRRLVVPASRLWHKESRSTGGPLSPTALFYLVRNTSLLAFDHATDGKNMGNTYCRHYASLCRRRALRILESVKDAPDSMEHALAILHGLECAAERRYGRREGSYRHERFARMFMWVAHQAFASRRFLLASHRPDRDKKALRQEP